jgi:hypothetical protein
MSDANHEINLALRTAAGHERAAKEAEAEGNKTYEMKMVSAGAAAYAAFKLAILAAPEYQGRKIDDDRIAKLYDSNKPRPWWDAHLAKVKVEGKPATRDWSNRTIQWHVNPAAAKARRAAAVLRSANHNKALKEKVNKAAYGVQTPQVKTSDAKNAKLADAVTEANIKAALGGRELEQHTATPLFDVTLQDCYGEINRIKVALGRMKAPAQFNEAIELLKAVARDLEKLT